MPEKKHHSNYIHHYTSLYLITSLKMLLKCPKKNPRSNSTTISPPHGNPHHFITKDTEAKDSKDVAESKVKVAGLGYSEK